ncbi:hypothetical protein Nepgr_024044 [Nepenthes gracilis]|uniref:Uncharacterized protein n=1 Tax=Nepenthes gracilis TaxID=150966 RepID=A0AAD3Y034_NEPGR|nr:hypothetical protein Nepgr_024044 [Nepenthes gracilis]
MGPLPSKISIKADGDVLAKDVVIVVDYQRKPKHNGNGCPANQKNSSKSTAAKQAVVNLNPDVVSVTSAEPEASNAIEKVPVDSISISPEEKVEILVNSTPASGMSGRLEDHSLDSDLNLAPQEGACAASGDISSSENGPISLPLQADADPPSDPDAVGSVADSLGFDQAKAMEERNKEPLSVALLCMFLGQDIQNHFKSLISEQRYKVLGFLDRCWCDSSKKTRDMFNSSFPMDKAKLSYSSDAQLGALQLLLAADSSKPLIDSLDPDEKQAVFGSLCFILESKSFCHPGHFSNLDELVAGIQVLEKDRDLDSPMDKSLNAIEKFVVQF